MNRRLWCIALAFTTQALGAQERPQEAEDVARREEYLRSFYMDGGRISEEGLRQLIQLRIERSRHGNMAALASAAISNTWVPLGPAGLLPQDGYYSSGTQLDAGRISQIAINPNAPDTWYAGTAGGGVWKTTNAGASWSPLTDSQCSLNIGGVAVDPKNPSIVYVGTGELNAVSLGCGILRSIDGGANWTRFGDVTFSYQSIYAYPVGTFYVDTVTAGSNNSTVVLAGTYLGVFRSTNSGLTWTKTYPTAAQNSFGRADAIVAQPGNPNVIYAGVGDIPPGSAGATITGGVFRSADKGVTWTNLPTPPGLTPHATYRWAVATSTTDPNKLWVAAASGGGRLTGFFVWDDVGQSWTTLNSAGVYTGAARADFGSQADYDFVLAVDPSNAQRIFIAGVRMFRSIDGGTTWRQAATDIHVDWHALTFDPTNPRRIVVGSDGGVFLSLDGGDTWTSRNYGLAITQYYPGIAVHPTDPTIVLGGSQDNGTHRSFGMPVWDGITGGDGGFAAINDQNPAILWTSCQWLPGACINRRSANGLWSRSGSEISSNDRAQFIPPLVMDPTNASKLYFATHRLWRTTNESNWTSISPDLTRNQASPYAISAIGLTKADTQTIYVGTSDGNIRVTRNGGTVWNVPGTGLTSLATVTHIFVDPLDGSKAFATFAGLGGLHVISTNDGGTTWTNITGNLPVVPVFGIVQIASENVLIIGTDVGVYQSADGGATWSPGPPGIPLVPVRDFVYNATTGTVTAATHGRGMFSLRIGAASVVLRGDVDKSGVVNAADALLIQRALIGKPLGNDATGQPAVAMPRGDTNCNGVLESVDALIALRFAVGASTGTGSCAGTTAIRAP